MTIAKFTDPGAAIDEAVFLSEQNSKDYAIVSSRDFLIVMLLSSAVVSNNRILEVVRAEPIQGWNGEYSRTLRS